MILKSVAIVTALAAAPTQCQHTAVVSDFCQFAGIIRPSRQDTPDTLKQIALANAKYRAVCSAAK